jgi:hypothetical protein
MLLIALYLVKGTFSHRGTETQREGETRRTFASGISPFSPSLCVSVPLWHDVYKAWRIKGASLSGSAKNPSCPCDD